MAKKKRKVATFMPTLGDSYAAIAELSPEALKATADLMEVADQRTMEILERQLQAEIASHSETRRRLSQANRQLDLIRARASWLVGDSFPDETIDEIEDVLTGHAPMNEETRAFGYCLKCIRVRWLDRVTGVDRLNNPEGVCSSCAKEEQQVTINLALCDHVIMDLRHWREDGTCRCHDPDHHLMEDWGYVWNEYYECWESPEEEEEYEDDDED